MNKAKNDFFSRIGIGFGAETIADKIYGEEREEKFLYYTRWAFIVSILSLLVSLFK